MRVGLMSDTSFLMLAIISEMASPRPFLSCIWISCNFTLKKVLLKPMMADFASATCFCCAASSPTSPTIAFSRLPSLLETPTIEAWSGRAGGRVYGGEVVDKCARMLLLTAAILSHEWIREAGCQGDGWRGGDSLQHGVLETAGSRGIGVEDQS